MDKRGCIIYLPNEDKLELSVNCKQLGKDLWDVVVSKLELREEDYFGLKYKAAGEHFSWLQMDKKIIDHDMETKSVEYPLEFIFSVKFYEDSVTVHKHATTVELIFLYAQNQIYREEIHVSCDMSLELAALALQAFYGDFVSDDVAFSNYKKLSCLPRTVILELPSIEYCEDQVISWYKSFCGISRGQAILLYMSKAEKLANYGVHFFKVKDKTRITWWLGISNKGIFQYNYTDTINPHTVFQWRNLENLYFREKKFSVEVCSGHKRSHSSGFTNISDKTAKKSSNSNHHPKTHTWYGSPQLIKSIWIMAIAQHQFYWDRKQSSKSKSNSNKTNATNLRNALDKNINSLIIPPTEDKNMPKKNHNDKYGQFTSFKKAPPHNNGRIPSSSHHHKQPERSPEILKWEKKMVTDLKKRKLDLEDRLYDKVQELKAVCLEEFGITEKLPIDYIRYMTIDEEKPVLRKKIETEYPVRLRHHNNNEKNRYDPTIANQLQQLESDCELLHQITNAAYKLAYDPSSRGRIKRNRLQSYKKSLKKLQEVENKIDELRLKQGKDPAMRHSTFITTSDTEILAAMKECSIDEKSEHSSLSDGILLEDEASISSGAEALSTHSTPASLHPDTSSADIDLDDDISVKRSRTPPPTRSKLAWLESPKVKGHKQQHMSPNHSYPVLPSPTSNRSTASSGADTPPHGVQGRTWKQHKWEHPRHQGDKVSSLDSLESIGSRKSNEKNLSSSPSRRRISPNGENANAMRIARATESARAHKVSLREKQRTAREPSHRTGTVNPILEIVQGTAHDVGKDSRTSLTDSGHGTDSRVQSYHEDELARRKHGANAIRRDISDSSLSELSTQSNPAALPSSGHVPKFVPYFMSKPRAASHTPVQDISSQQTESSTLRKRSSSFTESGNTIQKPVSRRDNPRTLSRSKTHYESDTLTKDSVRNEAFASDESFGASSNKSHPALSTSQSANELPPPVFETNLNICKQYLSRSQGQLAAQNNQTTATQNVPTQDVKVSEITYTSPNQNWSSMIANPADVGSKNSANNNNNKLNFGQIYQLSQGHLGAHNARLLNRSETPQGTSLAHNIPRGNSLDSILNRGHSTGTDLNPDTVKNYGLETEHGNKFHGTQDIQYPHYPAVSTTKSEMQQHHDAANFPPNMSVMDRDKFNNEAFQDIQGMGWVPSLDEYGSRASVAESLPAKSKKEDIMELLQQHIAHNWIPRRTPSTTGTNRKLQARIRAEMMRDKETKPTSSDPTVKTWEGYKQSVQTMKRSTQQPTIGHSTASVNIFAHKQPPPISATQQNSQTNLKKQFASDYSQHTIRKGYIDKNGYISLNERRLPSHHGNFQVSSQSSDYPDYTVPSPFERGYLSATLPRKYVMKDTSSKHPPTTTYPVNELPRTYSYTSGESRNFTPSANFSSSPENLARTHSHHPSDYASEVFYPRPKSSYTDQSTGRYQNLSQQHSTNYTSSTHPFTSLSQNFPATGNMANMTDSRKIAVGYKDTMSQQEKSTHKMTQPTNYHQQQQIKRNEKGGNSNSEFELLAEDTARVIQATRTSPDGHKVSVFTVTKSTPNTPMPSEKTKKSRKERNDDGNVSSTKSPQKSKPKLKTSLSQPGFNKSPLSPSAASDRSSQSNTDVFQALAIEAARMAQQALIDPQTNLDRYSLKKNLNIDEVSSPAGFMLRSSTRERRATGDFLSPITPAPRSNEDISCKTSKLSRKINERDCQSIDPNNEKLQYPVKDLRSHDENPTSRNFTPTFQRTLSTPIRSKPGRTRPGGDTRMLMSSQSKKTTGMYNESMSGKSPKVRPPAAPRSTVAQPRSSNQLLSDSKQQASKRQFPIGQSGTLPRPPRSTTKIERSGSTSGSAMHRVTYSNPEESTSSSNKLKHSNEYLFNTPTQRKDLYNTINGDEDLKYKRRSFTEVLLPSRATTPAPSQCNEMVVGASKPPLSVYQTATRCKTASVNLKRKNMHRRSMSETWKQPGSLLPTQQQYTSSAHQGIQQHPYYHHMGHQGLMPTTADPRLNHEPPRRTASADDLLWPEQRDGQSYNLRSQQGTLV